MSSRLLRLAIIVIPIVVGLIATAWGLNEYYEATVIITPKTPAPYGILAFSSMNFEIHDIIIWMDRTFVKDNLIDLHFVFGMSITSPLDEETSLDEQIFGFQIPYYVELGKVVARERSGLEPEGITIEIIDEEVHTEGDISIIYVKFIPLAGIEQYEFDVRFNWMNAIIKQTFSTYSLSVPISLSENNTFFEYFSNLNYSVHLPKFSGPFTVNIHLPADCEVREAIPPITREIIHSHPTDGGYSPDKFLEWSISIENIPNPAPFPISEVIRVTFESREELARHDRLLFDSGLWLGIGVSNFISGFYGALRYISGMQRRVQR